MPQRFKQKPGMIIYWVGPKTGMPKNPDGSLQLTCRYRPIEKKKKPQPEADDYEGPQRLLDL